MSDKHGKRDIHNKKKKKPCLAAWGKAYEKQIPAQNPKLFRNNVEKKSLVYG